LRFEIKNVKTHIEVFTTRPDTLFGATYLVLAPEYKDIENWKDCIQNWDEVDAYRKSVSRKKELERREAKEKTGIELQGIKAINPATKEEIPVWIADYVLAGYGTGSIMAVPAHDERDNAFAKVFNLPIRQVIAPHVIDAKNPPKKDKKTVQRTMVHGIVHDPKTDTYLILKWKKYPWTTFVVGGVEEGEDTLSAVVREIEEETGYTNLNFKKALGGIVCSEYFAAHKDENRFAHVQGYLFEIGPDTTCTSPDAEELEKHEVVWMTLKEFEADANRACAEYVFWKEMFLKEVAFT
jgi:8-oxo-dGTP pyrophosphatase MutT (NUDIX family)